MVHGLQAAQDQRCTARGQELPGRMLVSGADIGVGALADVGVHCVSQYGLAREVCESRLPFRIGGCQKLLFQGGDAEVRGVELATKELGVVESGLGLEC
jgi:hypothetical protein